DRLDLMDLVQTLKQENEGLKRELITASSRVRQLENVLGQARRSTQAQAYAQNGQAAQVRPSVPGTQQAAPTPTNAPRAYTIRSGDTLSAISKRFYGTPTRWIDIYQANRDRLSSESAIRVGQEIRIP
ncbi:MAG: LysM peptidoglycan-binding domain-containing protein, partial [Verrucomicrobiota bacterium]|nr:LysM peptidoglycan-binding domain-containing protein [Verrucomicrobiota bacterium]